MELTAKDVRNVEVLELGMKFKNLTILKLEYIDDKETRSNVYKQFYRVKCDCGAEYVRRRASILYNRKHSCPRCSKTYKTFLEKGDTFGKLVVTGEVVKVDTTGKPLCYTKYKYECLCSCGKLTVVSRDKLVSGHTRSCGCIKSSTMSETFSKENTFEYMVDGSVKVSLLNEESLFFFLDQEDWEKVKHHSWRLHNGGYVCTNKKGDSHRDITLLHREIMGLGLGDSLIVDHRDGDKLNCRQSNLRVCTHQDNNRNRLNPVETHEGELYGVIPYVHGKFNWRAAIIVDGESKRLGYFEDAHEALQVRFNAELKYFGEFSPILSRKLYEKYDLEIPHEFLHLLQNPLDL